MAGRTYAIPSLPALGLVLTSTGCSEAVVGVWAGESFSYNGGETLSLPYTYSSTYAGYTFSYTTNMSMVVSSNQIEDAYTGSFTTSYSYDVGGSVGGGNLTYDITAVVIDKNQYEISVPDMWGLVLVCDADKEGGTLQCSGVDEDDATYDIGFVRED